MAIRRKRMKKLGDQTIKIEVGPMLWCYFFGIDART